MGDIQAHADTESWSRPIRGVSYGRLGAMSDPEAAERIRRRYPKPRYVRYGVIALSIALLASGLTWLMWAAWVSANPPVSGQLESFDVTSDTRVSVKLIVERTDPSQAAVCNVIVQSESFERVGERAVNVPPSDDKRVRIEATVKTFKRGTAATVGECLIE